MIKRPYFISPYILQKLIWVPTRVILRFFVGYKISGLDNINLIKNNKAIFALNHTSELDPILLPASFPFFSKLFPMFYVSRNESFYSDLGWRKFFYGGMIFKMWGAYPVFSGQHDYHKSLINHIRIVNDGGSVCIFPEGRITKDGNIQPAKGGIVYLSHITDTPVIPVRLNGAWKMSFKDFILRRRTVEITIGKPIVCKINEENFNVDELKEKANKIMDIIRSMGTNQYEDVMSFEYENEHSLA